MLHTFVRCSYYCCFSYLGLQPKNYETFISVRALSRFIECQLLLWRLATFDHSLHRKGATKVSCIISTASYI